MALPLPRLWIVWLVASIIASAVIAYIMLRGDNKSMFMPGPLSSGHHQLGESCESCHTDAFGGGEVLQQACIDCHGDERKKPHDSHPIAKFKDPRNADMLSKIDAMHCVTCHQEHKPELTRVNGVTQPEDICFHCHQDIATERPSHEGMGFETCASSGCHNFHDNRALYFKFLVNNKDAPPLLDERLIPQKDFVDTLDLLIDYPRDKYPVESLNKTQADVPDSVEASPEILAQWSASGHAEKGVNCNACHEETVADNEDQNPASYWVDKPGLAGCSSCHQIEVDGFTRGKHGMRMAASLSPMKPAMARIPMHEASNHDELTCNSCHLAHDYNVVTASVQACESCHADDHTVAYRQSAHFTVWTDEIEGRGEPDSGVSCATCHMPRVTKDVDDYNSRMVVEHNQNFTLAPNSKMLRPVCMNCHGLEFSINALADRHLIDNNFHGQPAIHVESVDLARALHKEHERKKANK